MDLPARARGVRGGAAHPRRARLLPAGDRLSAPRHPVVFFNPRSGDGATDAGEFEGEAARRGIEVVECRPDVELAVLVREAVARGADALGMAGGDGSQATVAAVASEHALPYACIPAGTRNHFALDLGVDRDDVLGALDAFGDGSEHAVDLGEVNGRVFVNNVSLGPYGEAVHRPGYRNAKLRTLVATLPQALRDDGRSSAVSWLDPDGTRCEGRAIVIVSNNRYRLTRLGAAGLRPRLDAGVLGIMVAGEPVRRSRLGWRPGRRWRVWEAESFVVEAEESLQVGLDGEAVELEPPLRFRTRPRALRVLVARAHAR